MSQLINTSLNDNAFGESLKRKYILERDEARASSQHHGSRKMQAPPASPTICIDTIPMRSMDQATLLQRKDSGAIGGPRVCTFVPFHIVL